jgi:ABC-type transport system involved in multi-copper enzyme maturation permease subunit
LFDLIKFEWKKNKLGSYVKGAIIANVIMLVLLLVIHFGIKYGDNAIAFSNYLFVIQSINSMVRAVFIVFAAALSITIILEEYRNKTIFLLFLYPIDRRKLMQAKIMLIGIFTFIATLVSNLALIGSFYILDNLFHMVPGRFTASLISTYFIELPINALATVGIGLIPLFFGMKKKSTVTTVCTSVICALIFTSTFGDFSLGKTLLAPILFGAGGVLLSYFMIRNITKEDVL